MLGGFGLKCAKKSTISSAALYLLLVLHLNHNHLGQAQNSCHLRELDLCATSLLVLTQSPSGLATSEPEIQKQCGHLREASTCFRDYTKRCLTPIQREVLSLASNSTQLLLEDYCSKGTKFRLHYLKHATCLGQVYKKQEHRSCTRDLQVSLELLTEPESKAARGGGGGSSEQDSASGAGAKRLQRACCAYRRFESCVGGHIERRCGKEASQFVGATVRRASSRLPDTLCRAYKPDGPECRALLPKAGASPKGPKSSSIISRLLSAYSGL